MRSNFEVVDGEGIADLSAGDLSFADTTQSANGAHVTVTGRAAGTALIDITLGELHQTLTVNVSG